jgi:hypothetical protein
VLVIRMIHDPFFRLQDVSVRRHGFWLLCVLLTGLPVA